MVSTFHCRFKMKLKKLKGNNGRKSATDGETTRVRGRGFTKRILTCRGDKTQHTTERRSGDSALAKRLAPNESSRLGAQQGQVVPLVFTERTSAA